MSAKQHLNFANCTRKERLTFPVVNNYQIDIIRTHWSLCWKFKGGLVDIMENYFPPYIIQHG
jgi:hypothetical protein